MDGIYVNGSRAKFPSDNILSDIDSTLTVENTVPDSKVVGDRFATNEADISSINDTIGSETMGTDATTLTGAIAEHEAEIGSETMGTTATTLTGAIAEHESDITTINDTIGSETMGTDATTITGAIAEHEADLISLGTTKRYSFMLPSTVSTGIIIAKRAGIVMISVINISKLPTGSSTICTLPAGWRPPYTVMRKLETPNGTAGPIRATITTEGVFTLYNYGSSAISSESNISDTFCFATA